MCFLSASYQEESCLHSPRTPWPSPFQLMENIKQLHFSYFSIPHSFCPATYSAPIECSISINIAELLMGVPHCFFHCNKELYHNTLFVVTTTGRLCFEELQHRYHVSGTFTNWYIEWGKFKCVLTELTAFLICYSLRKKLWGIPFWATSVLTPAQNVSI